MKGINEKVRIPKSEILKKLYPKFKKKYITCNKNKEQATEN